VPYKTGITNIKFCALYRMRANITQHIMHEHMKIKCESLSHFERNNSTVKIRNLKQWWYTLKVVSFICHAAVIKVTM
jgi:hypothetical protein